MARCGCGTWRPNSRSAPHLPDRLARSIRWRSARIAISWLAATPTAHRSCGTCPMCMTPCNICVLWLDGRPHTLSGRNTCRRGRPTRTYAQKAPSRASVIRFIALSEALVHRRAGAVPGGYGGDRMRPVPGKPSAAAAASVGLPSEGRGEAAAPRRRVPGLTSAATPGHPGRFSPLDSARLRSKPRPGRQARRISGAVGTQPQGHSAGRTAYALVHGLSLGLIIAAEMLIQLIRCAKTRVRQIAFNICILEVFSP